MNWGIQIYDVYFLFMMIANCLVFAKSPKRKHFKIIYPISLILSATILYFLNGVFKIDNFFFQSLLTFLFCQIVLGLGMFASYQVNPLTMLSFCSIALALEQFSGGLRELIFTIFPSWTFGITNQATLTFFLQSIVVYPFIYLIFSFIYYRSKLNWNAEALNNPYGTIVSLFVIFFCIIINRFTKWNYEDVPWYWSVGRSLYAMVCSLMAMFLFFGVSTIIHDKREIAILEAHTKLENDRYQEWKDFHEMVSVSIHDMRHMIQDMKEKNVYADKMMERISSYEHHATTGNDTMDTLLYEKGNSCIKHSINFTHMVDGSALQGMEELDIYCLFSNLIDNAINASLSLEKEKRNISLIISKAGDATLIHISNYYDSTQKKISSPYHGFGLKSVALIVEKYSGTIKCTTNNELYEVDLTLIQKLK